MATFDQDRKPDLQPSDEMPVQLEPPLLTSPRRAMFSAASMVAIVAIMFVMFYAINAQRTHETASSATIDTNLTTGRR